MEVIGQRRRAQPAPPHIVYEALTDLDRPGARPWLYLLDDEQRPAILRSQRPSSVVWSSIWVRRPDAVIEFDLPTDGASGTSLGWTLLVDSPIPDPALTGHLRKRLNELINRDLRLSFGQ